MSNTMNSTGWALAEHTMMFESISDADQFKADSVTGVVAAYKHSGDDLPASIKFSGSSAGFEMGAWMSPACARKLAAALIKAADICEQFEAQQTESNHEHINP